MQTLWIWRHAPTRGSCVDQVWIVLSSHLCKITSLSQAQLVEGRELVLSQEAWEHRKAEAQAFRKEFSGEHQIQFPQVDST